MKVLRLTLQTNQIGATRRFYAETLGLSILTDTPTEVAFAVGWSNLTFRYSPMPVEPYHLAFNIPIGKLEQYQRQYPLTYLETDSATNTVASFSDWKAKASYFLDSNHNIVEFIERQDAPYGLSINTPFQGISEIGIVTDSVPALTSFLNQSFGVEQFTKSMPRPDCNAVGDDYGLFILAKTGRRWLFTDIPAARQNCSVLFSDFYGQMHFFSIST